MGGGVCAAAGELAGDDEMLMYGRERLQKTVEHAQFHGGFNEYNSPTYTMVALWECERTLHLVRDPGTREVIHPVAGRFGGRPLRWELGRETTTLMGS
jgi:hypothetical protein